MFSSASFSFSRAHQKRGFFNSENSKSGSEDDGAPLAGIMASGRGGGWLMLGFLLEFQKVLTIKSRTSASSRLCGAIATGGIETAFSNTCVLKALAFLKADSRAVPA